MKASVCKPCPATPRQAARRRAPVDRWLDAAFFKTLADPTRTRLLACLIKCRRRCSVSEVADCCAVDFSVVARHLALLARAGLLESEKSGRTVWYRPRGDAICSHLRALADAIEEWRPTAAPNAENAAASADGCCAPGVCIPPDPQSRRPRP